ncbi:CrcB family protein [uncultured Actinomyces sp.]|uniref:fluoride efflux transporter FluC n=1 Tax=uncultured Actinomyces sp. TaxID=249061 RepID=UPI0028EB1F1D|nr:CrcB family protein [uncultured Actinomyces sp.]
MTPLLFLLVCVFASLGALSRWQLDLYLKKHRAKRTPQWGIGVVNLLGCTCAGALAGILAPNAPVFFLLSTGFLGGFTTFSTAVLDAVMLIREHRYRAALGLVLGVWLGGCVLAVTGFLIAVSFAM